MTEQKLSATDAALRKRITELSVHIPCGGLRGPVPTTCKWESLHGRWQSCADEDSPAKWGGCDVPRALDLCIVCCRGTAGGTTRWSWLACADCLAVNEALESAWGFRPLALGRHSLMNRIGVRAGSSAQIREAQITQLMGFFEHVQRLHDWEKQEYARLASRFDPLADVPLRVWQQEWPPGRDASWDAFSRLIGLEPPRWSNE
ncbi:hypothetical protein [Mycobacterium palustre]|uniref:Uncharacterized protein n=1 Tax=Mycobacterium palustre TaxID=153971 RepID=A0A1X1Z3Q7_9MYCO|nr:hypothetical protein [Mycobacterium palustre]MCV7101099.1 hypothetical protein [Mycobacterium palustre]ORW17948.1 hypothetical protein AWC19_19940 [Mycobacterium palustre]